MQNRTDPSPTQARVLDGAMVAVAFGTLAILLGQEAFYKVDGHGLLRYLAGEGTHPRHPLTVPVLRAFQAVLAPLGLDDFRIVTVASAICTALGVFFAHVGFVSLRLARARAALATLLLACCPAVLFFATIVEFHGVFFAFAGLSFALFARCIASGRVWTAVCAGTSVGVAAAVHGLGHFLSPVFGVWAALAYARSRPQAARDILAMGASIAGAHAATFLLTQSLFSAHAASTQASFWKQSLAAPPDVARLPALFWVEYLRPYAALSIAWPLCLLRQKTSRAADAGMALGLVLYLATTWILVPYGDERGAYLTPLAMLGALAIASSLPLRLVTATAAVSLLIAVAELRIHDRPTPARAWMQAFEQCAQGTASDAFPLIDAIHEVDALARYDPLRPSLIANDIVAGLAGELSDLELATRRAGILQLLTQIEASGKRLLASASWIQKMKATERSRQVLTSMETAWRFERVAPHEIYTLVRR